jgi:hypothetical protein
MTLFLFHFHTDKSASFSWLHFPLFAQQEEECKKFLPFDDVVKLVLEAEKAPDREGNYHDYIELCKLYDKNENGTMMLAELENILSNLGKLDFLFSFFVFSVLSSIYITID